MKYPPGLVVLNGRKYVINGTMTEVPMSTRHQDLERPKETVVEVIRHSVPSSSGRSTHTVTQRGNSLSCDCVGYTYRRTCKHVKKIAQEVSSLAE